MFRVTRALFNNASDKPVKTFVRKNLKGIGTNGLRDTQVAKIIFTGQCQITQKHVTGSTADVRRATAKGKIVEFINKPTVWTTVKPLARMGKGKGGTDIQMFKAKPGTPFCRFVDQAPPIKTMRKIMKKMPGQARYKPPGFAGVTFFPETYKV